MQKDFIEGALAQPCWRTGGALFLKQMADFVRQAAAKGASIIASKDYHPIDHCSFAHARDCQNRDASGRYRNQLTAHCAFKATGDDVPTVPIKAQESKFCQDFRPQGGEPPEKDPESWAVPPFCQDDAFVGVDFDDSLAEVFKSIPPSQFDLVFKGIDEHYESFGSIARAQSTLSEEVQRTGGFALPEKQDDSCHGRWAEGRCYPTPRQLRDAKSHIRNITARLDTGGHGGGHDLRPATDILVRRGINKVIVVGLVYDFCVADTSLFAADLALWAGLSLDVSVIADLTRPALDGKPGGPYGGASFCRDNAVAADEPQFCVRGAGTTWNHRTTLNNMRAAGVEVVRLAS
eukprot:TRINITY_DN6094_c0_g1_i4.p1 TRINITY_DN6094_c0_g1~~TRINITY_DN6094_c0_g1_i4.p1  ORF type:complete len:348 (-),score=40.45 TRINITY_DN6094_c0_g1_i4:276-1319(-)